MASKDKKIVVAAPAKKKNNTLSLFKSRRLSTSAAKEKDDHVIKSDSFEFGASNEIDTVDGSVAKKNDPPSRATVVGPGISPPQRLSKGDGNRHHITDIPDPQPKQTGIGSWVLFGGRNGSLESDGVGRLSAASRASSAGRSSFGRRASLKMDTLTPHVRTHLSVQTPAALITMLDEPSLAGGGALAAERQTPAYTTALKVNEDAILSLSAILGDDHSDVIQRKLHTADVYKGLGEWVRSQSLCAKALLYPHVCLTSVYWVGSCHRNVSRGL